MLTSSWYALHVLTGSERKVAQAARQITGVAAIVPEQIIEELRSGQWRLVQRVIFPGYVFVRTVLSPTLYYQLTGIDDVISMLGSRDERQQPAPIPIDEMQAVLVLGNGGEPLGISTGTKTKNRTTVKDGPLKLLEPYITKVDARRKRATVKLTILGEKRTIDLGIQLEGTNSSPDASADTSPRETESDHTEPTEG